jgi:hypothetical protein
VKTNVAALLFCFLDPGSSMRDATLLTNHICMYIIDLRPCLCPGVNDTVVNQLLSKIDGVDQLNNILVIGMTNRYMITAVQLLLGKPPLEPLPLLTQLHNLCCRKLFFKAVALRLKLKGVLLIRRLAPYAGRQNYP